MPLGGAARDQIENTAERGGAVERGRRPLDHLRLLEIERRDLDEPELGCARAVERQAVGPAGSASLAAPSGSVPARMRPALTNAPSIDRPSGACARTVTWPVSRPTGWVVAGGAVASSASSATTCVSWSRGRIWEPPSF